jgi:hypothetical protein
VLAHLLEHVADPLAILRRIRPWLTARGRLICLVPNALSLHRQLGVQLGTLKRPTDLSALDKKVAHRRVYTPETLKQTVGRAGYTVVHFGGHFLKLLSNAQMENWPIKLTDGLWELGQQHPEISSEIFIICRARA